MLANEGMAKNASRRSLESSALALRLPLPSVKEARTPRRLPAAGAPASCTIKTVKVRAPFGAALARKPDGELM